MKGGSGGSLDAGSLRAAAGLASLSSREVSPQATEGGELPALLLRAKIRELR